ncbi:hypothetical protein [Actinoplanes sp. NPDC020271]|uniref:hypothetical protein n=1 Tax=Actinoplanes sp. NPDC020271 TaxID=3363896 RepID=UPI00378B4DC0
MMINILGWVARRRSAVLIMALVTAVALQVLLRATGNAGHAVIAFLPVFVLFVPVVVAVRSFRPAGLVARPEVPALDVPTSPGVVLGTVLYTFFVVPLLIEMLVAATDEPDLWWMFAGSVSIIGGMTAAYWRRALARFETRLTPDGITDRRPYGSLFVPWDALEPYTTVSPGGRRVDLSLARPGLVRRRGWRLVGPAVLPAVGADAHLLARTINEYANHPGLRPAIGTEPARIEV